LFFKLCPAIWGAKTITILSSICIFGYSQTDEDYYIYSSVINYAINNYDKGKTLPASLLVKKRIELKEYVQDIQQVIEDLYIDKEYRNWKLNYDTTSLRIVENESVRKCLTNLKQSISDIPTIDCTQLDLKVPSCSISNFKFNRLFLFGVQNGWDKFYKRYPKSAGVFSLSKVVLTDDFACLYVEHEFGGLAASGDIMILNKRNSTWTIILSINVWVS
jgi:hypothetical protein